MYECDPDFLSKEGLEVSSLSMIFRVKFCNKYICHIWELMGYKKLGTTKTTGIFVSSENLLKPISCHFQTNVYM